MPMPINTLAVTRERKLVERAPITRPSIKIPKIISSILFLPYVSDNLPAIGVMTAPVTRGAASIQDESSYEMSKIYNKFWNSRRTIVSEDIAIMPRPLNIASVIQGEVKCFSTFCMSFCY